MKPLKSGLSSFKRKKFLGDMEKKLEIMETRVRELNGDGAEIFDDTKFHNAEEVYTRGLIELQEAGLENESKLAELEQRRTRLSSQIEGRSLSSVSLTYEQARGLYESFPHDIKRVMHSLGCDILSVKSGLGEALYEDYEEAREILLPKCGDAELERKVRAYLMGVFP